MLLAPDGRTIGGLDHQIEVHDGHAETQSVANELAIIKRDTQILPVLRPAMCVLAKDEDLNDGIAYAKKRLEPTKWPQETRTALLNRETAKTRDCDPTKLAQIMFPLQSATFNPCAPTVSSFEFKDEGAKIVLCERLLYQESFPLLIKNGATGEASLCRLVRALLAKYDMVDPLETAVYARERVKIWTLACKYLELLIDVTVGASHEESLIVTFVYYYFSNFIN